MLRFAHLEYIKFSSLSFVIRVNLLHSCYLVVYYYLLGLVELVSYYFQVTLKCKVIFYEVKITQNL